MILKLGSKGPDVANLQKALFAKGYYNSRIDGDFGPKTLAAVKAFQSDKGLFIDGIVGPKTFAMLHKPDYYQLTGPKFIVFIDAGHGGLDDNNNYTTRGKYYRHKGLKLHKGDYFLEGVENRIIAEKVCQKLSQLGINFVRTYHPYKDWSLSDRVEIVKGWLRRGYYGYLHSIHSNAISTSFSQEKLDNTRGFITFNTRGDTFSDQISTQHFKHMQQQLPEMTYRTQMKDGDIDYEANFKILRETDTKEFRNKFAAVMDEHDFFTSRPAVEMMMHPLHRWKRTAAIVDTVEWTKKIMDQKIKK